MKFLAAFLGASLLCATPSIVVIGDSTASNVDHRGWADPLPGFFDSSKVQVKNRARAGRSARTFLNEGLWDKAAGELQPGDWVLIQFGHNDGGAIEGERGRGELPGIGEEVREITRADAQAETVHTFGWYNRKFIRDSVARGAHAILLSPTVRNIWKDGKVEQEFGNFGEWAREVATAEGIPFVDASHIIAERFQSMGPDAVGALFPQDHTHTSAAGAELNASLIVAGLKGMNGNPFEQMLSAKGATIAATDRPVTMPANPRLPTIWIIGDSTVRNGKGDGSNGQWGWGEPLVALFDASQVNVVNRALGGRSSRTYWTEGQWRRVAEALKPGDWVIMQFGHNDSSPVNDRSRARGTIRGIGEEVEEIDNLLTGKHEVVHSYGWYLRLFIAEAREHGATPVVCSPIPRMNWKEGKIERSGNSYGGWAKQVAAAAKADFVDLNGMIADHYDRLGPAGVEPLFKTDHTHTSREGAELNAAIVVAGLRGIKGDPLGSVVKAGGRR